MGGRRHGRRTRLGQPCPHRAPLLTIALRHEEVEEVALMRNTRSLVLIGLVVTAVIVILVLVLNGGGDGGGGGGGY